MVKIERLLKKGKGKKKQDYGKLDDQAIVKGGLFKVTRLMNLCNG